MTTTTTPSRTRWVRVRRYLAPAGFILLGLLAGLIIFTPSKPGDSNLAAVTAAAQKAAQDAKQAVQDKVAVIKMTVEQQGVKARELFSAEIASAPDGVEYKGNTVTAGPDVAPRTGCERIRKTSADGTGYALWKCRRQ